LQNATESDGRRTESRDTRDERRGAREGGCKKGLSREMDVSGFSRIRAIASRRESSPIVSYILSLSLLLCVLHAERIGIFGLNFFDEFEIDICLGR